MPLLSTSESSRSALHVARPARTWLIADDLTGACDAGAAFLRAGMSVRVWLQAQPGFAAPEAVQAVNTATRALPAAEAARAVASAAAALDRSGLALFFKKVDSTLRGPVAAELEAARSGLGTRAALLAPAFPVLGRTVQGGMLQAQDISGQSTSISIRDLFPAEMQESLAFISAPNEIAAALLSEKTILVCDSATQDDLEALVRATQPLPPLLYAGSAGLAQAIASFYASPVVPEAIPPAERVLVVCGTPHPVTALQLEALDRNRFAAAEVLRIRCESGDEAQVRDAFYALRPDALVLTGGDTALLALRALGVHSLALRGECAVGIPWSRAEGGAADGCTVVTKSGGFGARTVFNEILQMLTESL